MLRKGRHKAYEWAPHLFLILAFSMSKDSCAFFIFRITCETEHSSSKAPSQYQSKQP